MLNNTTMLKKLSFVCSLAAAFVLFTSAKPEASIASYDAAIKEYIESAEAVGLSTAVFSGNKIIYTNAYGMKDVENETPLAAGNVFKVGLSGRVLVSIAVYQLVDAGVLTTKDDISKWLGFEVRNPKYPDTPISIGMLLKQTSSLKDSKEFTSIADLRAESGANIWSKNKPLTYSKSYNGFVVLAAIVEKATGLRFDEYVKTYIFEPLKINASYISTDFGSGEKASAYYLKKSGEFQKTNKLIYKNPKLEGYVPGETTVKLKVNRNLMISAEDMAKILLTIVNDGVCPLYKVRLLSEKSAQLLTKPTKSGKRSAAGAVSTKKVEGATLTYSSGSWNGHQSYWIFDKEQKLGIVVYTNGLHNGEISKKFATELSGIFANVFYN